MPINEKPRYQDPKTVFPQELPFGKAPVRLLVKRALNTTGMDYSDTLSSYLTDQVVTGGIKRAEIGSGIQKLAEIFTPR